MDTLLRYRYMKDLKNKYKTKKTTIMRTTKKEVVDTRPRYKVQIDYRTIITVRTMEALKSWQQKYPEAKLVA